MARRRPSLHLGSAPIPPSLISSPYLNSPIFGQDVSESHLPTEQDELWLQDTVPLSPTSSGSSGSLATLTRDNSLKHPHQNIARPAPQSPPIIINHPSRAFRSRDRSNTQPPPYKFTHPRDLHCPANSHSLSHAHLPLAGPSSSIAHPSPPQKHFPHPYPFAIHSRPCTWAPSHARKYSDSDLTRLVKESITVGTSVSAGRDFQRENPGDRETGANAPVSPLR